MNRIIAAMLLVGLSLSPLQAMGKKPAPNQGFPDYNRLELRPKVSTSTPTTDAEIPASPPPFVPGPTKAEVPPPSSDGDVAPKPPPQVVPLKDGSEPTMPDDMLDTLIPGQSTGSATNSPKPN